MHPVRPSILICNTIYLSVDHAIFHISNGALEGMHVDYSWSYLIIYTTLAKRQHSK